MGWVGLYLRQSTHKLTTVSHSLLRLAAALLLLQTVPPDRTAVGHDSSLPTLRVNLR